MALCFVHWRFILTLILHDFVSITERTSYASVFSPFHVVCFTRERPFFSFSVASVHSPLFLFSFSPSCTLLFALRCCMLAVQRKKKENRFCLFTAHTYTHSSQKAFGGCTEHQLGIVPVSEDLGRLSPRRHVLVVHCVQLCLDRVCETEEGQR